MYKAYELWQIKPAQIEVVAGGKTCHTCKAPFSIGRPLFHHQVTEIGQEGPPIELEQYFCISHGTAAYDASVHWKRPDYDEIPF